MAGNPYTESGEKFQIPDMLSNRADIYNLGELAGEHSDAFDMSYIENCLTSNPVLNKLATRSQKDVYTVMEMARRDQREVGDLEGNYSLDELNEMVNTMQKLMRVRDVILTVNREYINSAAQSDDYRTEPPFKLQGSYRNMNRIAEKIVPIMNADEVEQLIIANYENDSQTLTSDTEANMLKFKELIGAITPDEQQRWEDIKRTFQQNVQMRGVAPDDKVGQVVVQLRQFSDGLHDIHNAMVGGFEKLSDVTTSDVMPADKQAPAGDSVPAGGLDVVQATLDGLRDSLDGIREAVTDMGPNLAEVGQAFGAALQTNATANLPAPTIAADRSSTSLEATAATIANIQQNESSESQIVSTQTEDPGHQKITVINKLPRSFLRVLDTQFTLMENWMKPILESTQSQSTQMSELKASLDDCLANYQRLVNKLRSERGDK